jgi:hypothetical protein
MGHPTATMGSAMPRPPGRTPLRSAPRSPGGETLLDPGACVPCASRTARLRASGTTMRATTPRPSRMTSREGGNELR